MSISKDSPHWIKCRICVGRISSSGGITIRTTPQNEHPAYRILERAYNHRERDLKTAELFLEEQLSVLEFGAHHFPDGCCIERSAYREAVTLAEKILTENNISQGLADELDYYRRLYTVWYEWFDSGRQGDFAEKCRAAGLKWEEIPAYYYS